MSNGRSRGRRFPIPRRRKGWEEGPGQQGAQSTIATSTSVIMASGAQVLFDGFTLLRLRGSFTASLSASSVASGGFSGAVGVGICEQSAFAIGVTACPTPITEQDWDGWLFWEAFNVTTITATIGDGVNSTSLIVRIPVDSKAMRKLNTGDTIYAVVQVAEVGTAILNTHFDSRILLALA